MELAWSILLPWELCLNQPVLAVATGFTPSCQILVAYTSKRSFPTHIICGHQKLCWMLLCSTGLGSAPCVCTDVQLCPTLWDPQTVAYQALLSMEFSRQENWSWWPFPTPGGLLDPGTEPTFLVSPALAGQFFTYHCTTCEALSSQVFSYLGPCLKG